MRTASISELKKELQAIPPSEVAALCLRLARFKKDNKELLTYLLFDAHDEHGYVESVKAEVDEGFDGIRNDSPYNAKKRLRKILRVMAKHIRFMGSRQAEAELLLHYCTRFEETGLLSHYNTVINNIFLMQMKKLSKLIDALHEDLQFDYRRQFERLVAAVR
ncbi:hypothetical protein [Chitinophaga solisilvae]|uniref:Uncharacterized protein n=1 Tax=Chitinophaga solisilvae TaxID=1233460 RepID=A0A3S1CVI9_9BACT|nr:hypothetical protein [Chitinophaga solisilvae]NSL86143.1 hypothetical protein [Chitinophaga solisilvae]